MIVKNTPTAEIEAILKRCPSGTVIGEFSGRDSVAAILKAMENPMVTCVLPIASFASTEYGDPNSLNENYKQMTEIVRERYGEKKILMPLIYFSQPEIWAILNGRYMTALVEKFGFVNPCVACHLYFHLLKLPFAKTLNAAVISGERASHDGRIKVNQLPQVLDVYKEVMTAFDVALEMPIREVSDGKVVEELIGWSWAEGKDHPKCLLSGNYRAVDGKALYDENQLKSYLEAFLIPVGVMAGKVLLGKATEEELTDEVKKCLRK